MMGRKTEVTVLSAVTPTGVEETASLQVPREQIRGWPSKGKGVFKLCVHRVFGA